jgi:hypothetical protein
MVSMDSSELGTPVAEALVAAESRVGSTCGAVDPEV